MTTAIQFLRSNVPGLRPNPLTLSDGMPMVNYNPQDPGLYFRSNDNTLLKIGPTHYSALPPNYNGPGYPNLTVGEMWLDTSGSDPQTPRPILKVWSGAAWVAAGGSIINVEQPQAKNTVLVGPYSGPDALPTFRLLGNDDLPDDIDYQKLAGGDLEGGLLIGGGTFGWGATNLTMGPGLTQTVGPNSITLEASAGDIAADGSPGANFANGDGHIQLNYSGKFTGDARFKFLNKENPSVEDKFIAHVTTELGQDPLNHTHTIKGDTTLSGDLTLTNVYSISAGGDLTVGHNATFGASPVDLFQVYGTTTFYEDVTIDGLNDLIVGGDVTVTNNTSLGTGDANTHVITGHTNLNGDVELGRDCNDAVLIHGTATFDCGLDLDNDLTVGGDVLLGTDCTNTLGVQGTQYNKCDVLIGENLPTVGSEQIYFHADTGLSEFKQDVQIGNDLQVGNNLPVGWNFAVDGTTGDVTSQGTVTADFFVGDGSQLFNLAIPNSILFHGDIDATVGPVPLGPQAGDFYIHTGPSTSVLGSWPDIGGFAIQQDQFIYFYDDGAGGKWALGSVQNQQGFVTINSNQDINGSKTFTSHQQFNETLTVADGKVTTLGGTLLVKDSTTIGETLNCVKQLLTVNGLATFNCEATFNGGISMPGGDMEIDGNLTVNGNTILGDNCTDTLTVTATTQINCPTTIVSSLTVSGPNDTSLGQDLLVSRSTTLGSSVNCGVTALTVNGQAVFECLATFNSGITIPGNNDLLVGGNLTVNGNTVLGDNCADTLTITATTQINCQTTVNNTFTVGAFLTTLGGGLTVTANQATTLGGTLTVAASQATSLGGTLTVAASQATSLGGTLTVAANQATTLGGTLTVADAKASTLGGTLLVKQATTLFASTNCAATALTVNGLATFNCKATFNGGIDLPGTNNLTVGGNLTVNGNTTLGDNCADTLTITATTRINCPTTIANTLEVTGVTTVNTHVLPKTDGAANLGSTSQRFANLYTQDMHFSNEGTEGNSVDGTTGNWTLQEGHDYLYFINNKTGVKFRLVMEKV